MEVYEELEYEFGKWAQVDNVVACSSGTAALHLALEALRLPPGSEVIVPDFTMVACARAVTLAGLTPVFVDCDSRLNMDPDWVDEAISDETRAILAVHTYGRQCDMGALGDLATKYDLLLIEDLAEAHGIRPSPETDAACWSFYRNKIVAGEEGGAVAFRDSSAAKRARCLRCLGFTESHDFTHLPRGHNYRLANALAFQILFNLRDVDKNVKKRRAVEAEYESACPAEWRMPERDAPWVYDFRIPGLKNLTQNRIVTNLQDCGVAARHGFKPMSLQDEYRAEATSFGYGKAYEAAREVIYLPLANPAVQEYPGVVPRRRETTDTPSFSQDAQRLFEVVRACL